MGLRLWFLFITKNPESGCRQTLIELAAAAGDGRNLLFLISVKRCLHGVEHSAQPSADTADRAASEGKEINVTNAANNNPTSNVVQYSVMTAFALCRGSFVLLFP